LFVLEVLSFYFFKENNVAVQQMEKLLKADTRSSVEVIKELEKTKTDGQKSERIIRK
jgi:hypothetical protein